MCGEDVAQRHFHLLPRIGNGDDTILHDLFAGEDVRLIKEQLGLPANSAFDKALASLFYHPARSEIVSRLSRRTKDRFAQVFAEARPL